MLAHMFVMHPMRLSQCPEIHIVSLLKPRKTLMDQHVMNQKIRRAIKHYTKPDEKSPVETVIGTPKHQQKTGCGENRKKNIILLEYVM